MKKSIIIVILFGSLLGYLFGNFIFKNYQGTKYIEEDGNIYFLQYGVYTNEEAAISNTQKLTNYKIYVLDDKYYVYLGITSNYDVALKLQNIYKQKNIYTYIRKDYVENSETLNILKKYDKKIENLDNEEQLENVMKEILENNEIKL